ncbi:MAG TPA: bifunctional DNA-formamidopyrimidine glycosylase/DNA-(apurinic or apyrimidinic site) lyase, partial [Burkholderiales bacterium]
EITRRGIAPHLQGQVVTGVVIRHPRLRWPIPAGLNKLVTGRKVKTIDRRGKYLLLGFEHGTLILHLGMSGSLRVIDRDEPAGVHDHFDLVLGNVAVRLRDPRRFGAVLWTADDVALHPLLANLGVEPLSASFTSDYLHAATRRRKQAIKLLLMDHHVVVGVGNIYANESLFRAGIRPSMAAGRLTRTAVEGLIETVQQTLRDALAAGGSSLRDFVHSDGASGYFQQQYFVYGRDGEACRKCSTLVRRIVQGQRATFYCPTCQPSRPSRQSVLD